MTDYVIAPVKPTHRQILRAATAVLNRAPTPDEYRAFYTTYQEMLSGQPDYGLAIIEKRQIGTGRVTDPDSPLHALAE